MVKQFLRSAAFGLAAVAVGGWLVLGANRGWTKTTVPIPQKDQVTDQDYVVWEKRFVPGVDLLAVSLGGALALFVASLFVRKTKSKQISASS